MYKHYDVKPLGMAYSEAWRNESGMIRLSCLDILVKGYTKVFSVEAKPTKDNVELWKALKRCGCTSKAPKDGNGPYIVTVDGAQKCYKVNDLVG